MNFSRSANGRRTSNFPDRFRRGVAIGSFILAWLSSPLALAQKTAQDCLLLEKSGQVEISRKGTTDWRAGETNQILHAGDRLRTGSRSRATLRWSELSVVRVREFTTMEIQPPADASGKNQLELRSGATYFFSREKPESIQFRTPVASGAIRGTEFNLEVKTDGQTELALLDGEVRLANDQGTVTLAGGELASVKTGQAPQKTSLVEAINIIQWALYYPIVIDVEELQLSSDEKKQWGPALHDYALGSPLEAMNHFPESTSGSSGLAVFRAALLLSAGKVEEAAGALEKAPEDFAPGRAIRTVIAAVKHQGRGDSRPTTSASEWLAQSYYLQSRGDLPGALAASRQATVRSPEFGAAWVRLAEMEFSFGHSAEGLRAVEKGRALSPKNAQGMALEGFLYSARGNWPRARESFDEAIRSDGALANGWLGRGLLKIRAGHSREGRADLQVAATLEPQRAVLRSYLGKAFSEVNDLPRARKELKLSQRLDPNDPSSWLYLALLDQQDNRINDAIEDLEKSRELNDNRSVFRSRMLLDQDQAVRQANLAAMYRDAGMPERGVQEAARAVNNDYANYSAHLFLSESYDSLRDPKLINLRYETPWFSELLVANLLAPVSGGNLSQNISQQEYSRLFAADGMGVFSSTEYRSRGDWTENASQYGVFGHSGYSIDAFYRNENGFRPNNDLEQLNLSARFKQELTAQDSIFFQASYFDSQSGDLAQYYNQTNASQTLRVTETQEPNILVGYHREWGPGSHTLILASRFDDTLTLRDSAPGLLFLGTAISPFSGNTNVFVANPSFFSLNYRSALEAYSVEAQQIWENDCLTFIGGGRYQFASSITGDLLERTPPLGETTQIHQRVDADLTRESLYFYAHWQPLDSLRLIGGVTYDRLEFPADIDTSPISSREDSREQFSPKAGILWSPLADTHFRGIYTRSLGGVFFDNSIRLEPAQIAGFNQSFRSLIPESVVGLVPGTRFETFGVGVDQSFKTHTYFTIDAQLLNSDASRSVGIITNSDPLVPIPDSGSATRQTLGYREKSIVATLNQLVGRDWALGVRYRLTDAELTGRFPEIPAGTFGAGGLTQNNSATLHQVTLFAIYQHPCGFFGEFDAVWSKQSNHGYSPDLPGDNFWQYDFNVGYRFLQRRVEACIGLLNLTDRDYRLNPLTLYNELPRERTLVASLKLNF